MTKYTCNFVYHAVVQIYAPLFHQSLLVLGLIFLETLTGQPQINEVTVEIFVGTVLHQVGLHPIWHQSPPAKCQ